LALKGDERRGTLR